MPPRPVPFRLVATVALTTLVVVAVVRRIDPLDRPPGGLPTAGARPAPRRRSSCRAVGRARDGGTALADADRARLRDLARVMGVRVTLIDGAGGILLDSDARPT